MWRRSFQCGQDIHGDLSHFEYWSECQRHHRPDSFSFSLFIGSFQCGQDIHWKFCQFKLFWISKLDLGEVWIFDLFPRICNIVLNIFVRMNNIRFFKMKLFYWKINENSAYKNYVLKHSNWKVVYISNLLQVEAQQVFFSRAVISVRNKATLSKM